MNEETLPALPSSTRAKALVDTVYFYTQARYCIVEWTQLREWHRDREAIAYTSTKGPVASQTGKCIIFVVEECWANVLQVPSSSGSSTLLVLTWSRTLKAQQR